MDNQQTLTTGVHHVGLSVANLTATEHFFTGALNWTVVRRVEDYPAVFVSDGAILITLWQTDDDPASFDRRKNVGLHHLALRVESNEALNHIYEQVCLHPGVTIEFAPEYLRNGPARHMMCYEPSGVRIEFIYVP